MTLTRRAVSNIQLAQADDDGNCSVAVLRVGARHPVGDPVVVLLGLRGAADPGGRAGAPLRGQDAHPHLCGG